ncbi:MAG: hypothetical protein GX605_14340 [Chloroflexi bacterium]|nr:hypothetical protein [Chloroflexota bacterium]
MSSTRIPTERPILPHLTPDGTGRIVSHPEGFSTVEPVYPERPNRQPEPNTKRVVHTQRHVRAQGPTEQRAYWSQVWVVDGPGQGHMERRLVPIKRVVGEAHPCENGPAAVERDNEDARDLPEDEIDREQLFPHDTVTDVRDYELSEREAAEKHKRYTVRQEHKQAHGCPQNLRIRVAHPKQCPRNWQELPAFVDAAKLPPFVPDNFAANWAGKVLVTAEPAGSIAHRFARAFNTVGWCRVV